MFTRVALVTTLAVTAGAAKTLKLTWSDCGDASTHAKVTSLSTDHIVTGTPSPVTGTGTVDEDVAGGSYAIDLAAGIIKEHWTGDICEPKTFQMPLAAGSIKWLGMKCPQAKGTATVGTEIDLSSLLPSFLTHANIKITATDKAGNKLLCFSVATAPETELLDEAAAQLVTASSGACAADDQSFIQGHPGTGGDSFGQMGHDCGYEAYSIFSGFDENTFKTCIEGKGIKSDSCAGCFADIAKYGADNCKMACISNWCSKGCLDCAHTPNTKSTLNACAGFPTPEVAPCDGGDEYGEYDTRVVV